MKNKLYLPITQQDLNSTFCDSSILKCFFYVSLVNTAEAKLDIKNTPISNFYWRVFTSKSTLTLMFTRRHNIPGIFNGLLGIS